MPKTLTALKPQHLLLTPVEDDGDGITAMLLLLGSDAAPLLLTDEHLASLHAQVVHLRLAQVIA